MELRHAIATDRDYLFQLANVTFIGLQQYTLYSVTPLTVMNDNKFYKYSTYIIDNFDLLHKIKYNYYNHKVPKINLQTEVNVKKAKKYIETLILPYFNKHCFKTLNN